MTGMTIDCISEDPMTMRTTIHPLLVAVLALVSCMGCTPAPAPFPPGPVGVQDIAIQPPSNQTGRDLIVDQPGLLGSYLGEKRETVPEVLAGDVRSLLRDRGFRVLTGNAEGVPTLRTEIRRWDPYSADYSRVTVSLLAMLIDPTSGRTLWTVARSDWNVETPAARNGQEASGIAARDVARALVEGWQPGGSRPPATP
jgi:hypothetical protein